MSIFVQNFQPISCLSPHQAMSSVLWDPMPHTFSLFFFFFSFFLATLHAACGIWDHSSLTRDRSCAPCSGSTESQPLDRQGSPLPLFNGKKYCIIQIYLEANCWVRLYGTTTLSPSPAFLWLMLILLCPRPGPSPHCCLPGLLAAAS